MARMTAAQAAMYVLEKEGITTAFGVPGAAINPFYNAMRLHGKIRHVLARHVEGASHMAEGYTRAKAGNIGVCLGLLPTKGLTLPLMSYGGSGIVMNLCALAILLRVDIENRILMRGGRV
mgnify:CR=1 FL=1